MKKAPALRRLRFAHQLEPDESVIGALASACHEQRLRSIASALDGCCLQMMRPGLIQIAPIHTLEGVASIMRIDVAALQANAYERGRDRSSTLIGDLLFPRVALELKRRRISPVALRTKNYHRNAWLNRLLPYCPETLERLVDQCPSCGPIGWRQTRGIGFCEKCGEAVPTSGEYLPAELTHSYRCFASLVSRRSDDAAKVVGLLPEPMNRLPRSALVNLAVRAGIVFESRGDLRTLPQLLAGGSQEIANAVCLGIDFLLDWPDAIRQSARSIAVGRSANSRCFERFLGGVRQLTRDADPCLAGILKAAFPTLDNRRAETFSIDDDFYTATQVNRLLSIDSDQLSQLRRIGAVQYEALPGKVRTIARYQMSSVDRLRAHLDESVTLGKASVELGVPVYALTQLVDLHLLDAYLDRSMVVLRGAPHIKSSSLEDLVSDLCSSAQGGKASRGLVPLKRALTRFPGEKPYGIAIQAMLDGRLEYYISGSLMSARDFLIDERALSRVEAQRSGQTPSKPLATVFSLENAVELLGTTHVQGLAAIRSAGLDIITTSKGKGVDRSDLLALAERIAFTGEAAAAMDRHPISLSHEFKRLKVPRVHGAWCRKTLADLGFVQKLELVTA